jgi:hypothetical protein
MEQCTPGRMTMEQRPPTRLAHETCDVLAALDRIEGDRELPVPWSSWGIPSHHGPYTDFIGHMFFVWVIWSSQKPPFFLWSKILYDLMLSVWFLNRTIHKGFLRVFRENRHNLAIPETVEDHPMQTFGWRLNHRSVFKHHRYRWKKRWKGAQDSEELQIL